MSYFLAIMEQFSGSLFILFYSIFNLILFILYFNKKGKKSLSRGLHTLACGLFLYSPS